MEDGERISEMLQRYAVSYFHARKRWLECRDQDRTVPCDDREDMLMHESSCRPLDMTDEDWEDLLYVAEYNMRQRQENLAKASLLRRLWEDHYTFLVKYDTSDWRQYDSYVGEEAMQMQFTRAAEDRYRLVVNRKKETETARVRAEQGSKQEEE